MRMRMVIQIVFYNPFFIVFAFKNLTKAYYEIFLL